MKRTAEFTLFAGIAALIHVALFASAPDSGVHSSGAGGSEMISVQAADATVARMVEAWERPLLAQPQLAPDPAPPLQAPAAPELPQFDLARAPQAAAQIALAEPAPAEPPVADTAPPPPPPPERKPAPAAKPRPKPQPAQKPEPQQARKAEQTTAGRAEQRAAGSGGGAQTGQSGDAAAATARAGQQAKLQTIWGAKIRTRIERRKRYPSGASGKGTVVVRLTVARSGQLLSHRIARSSGNAALDQAALKAVLRAGKFPAAPKELGLSQLSFNLPMSFSR
ncbi:cell envelope integrity protein TolA [Leisingera thetidis]|uniref:cell envelope integrity protein TolA n=1 Tax=Leisingera thetidis TaxID=2930199 RepID=UPI0021F762DB|nr:cell envelope integrity protein TolA [Leisingera thetidis]